MKSRRTLRNVLLTFFTFLNIAAFSQIKPKNLVRITNLTGIKPNLSQDSVYAEEMENLTTEGKFDTTYALKAKLSSLDSDTIITIHNFKKGLPYGTYFVPGDFDGYKDFLVEKPGWAEGHPKYNTYCLKNNMASEDSIPKFEPELKPPEFNF